MIRSESSNKIIACHDCGQVVHLPEMHDNSIALCSRCGAKLFSSMPDTIDKTLSLAFTCLILFIIANMYPFLAIRLKGFVQETDLVTGILTLYGQKMPGLASLVLLTTVILPLFQILGLIYVYLPIKFGYTPWKAAYIYRAIHHIRPWGMMEVYMLGILISMIKLAKMATIVPGFASGAFMVLICILTATLSGINPDDVWRRLPIKDNQLDNNSNKKLKLVGCRSCSLLCQTPDMEGRHICPRCEASLHIRKTNSLNRTWALLIAACVFYLPANILPVTVTSTVGHEQSDTILSGVFYFLFSGSWHIALVIFIASIIVPLMKVIILFYLLMSIHIKSTWSPEDRTRLYRITETVGRWSMVDIYVVTILVSLVQLGPLANIQAGPGALYFSAVVVLTMFAAESFDPRLIWDAMEKANEHT